MGADLPCRDAAALLSSVALATTEEVHDAVVEHATHLGRMGIMVRLRVRARELAQSPIGRDQLRSLAFDAAADDIAWGRAPLATWRTFDSEVDCPADLERLDLRLQLPPPDPAVRSKGEKIAQEIEWNFLASLAGPDTSGGLLEELSRSAAIQAALWGDPRIIATQDIRLVMQASIAPLQRRHAALSPRALSPQLSRPAPHVSGWRKLFSSR